MFTSPADTGSRPGVNGSDGAARAGVRGCLPRYFGESGTEEGPRVCLARSAREETPPPSGEAERGEAVGAGPSAPRPSPVPVGGGEPSHCSGEGGGSVPGCACPPPPQTTGPSGLRHLSQAGWFLKGFRRLGFVCVCVRWGKGTLPISQNWLCFCRVVWEEEGTVVTVGVSELPWAVRRCEGFRRCSLKTDLPALGLVFLRSGQSGWEAAAW